MENPSHANTGKIFPSAQTKMGSGEEGGGGGGGGLSIMLRD